MKAQMFFISEYMLLMQGRHGEMVIVFARLISVLLGLCHSAVTF